MGANHTVLSILRSSTSISPFVLLLMSLTLLHEGFFSVFGTRIGLASCSSRFVIKGEYDHLSLKCSFDWSSIWHVQIHASDCLVEKIAHCLKISQFSLIWISYKNLHKGTPKYIMVHKSTKRYTKVHTKCVNIARFASMLWNETFLTNFQTKWNC